MWIPGTLKVRGNTTLTTLAGTGQRLTQSDANGLQSASNSLAEGQDLSFGTSTGTKLGTATSQKLGLFGVTPIIQPAHADQAAVTLGNTNGAIGGLTISAAYSQAEVQALRDACETLADDVRALSTLVHALRTAGVNLGTIKGAA